MVRTFSKAWRGFLRPMILRPRRQQVAALCFREKNKATQVLLITSRGTGRWIIPKGWPMDGLSDARAAQTEAWEEAGVKGTLVNRHPIGRYSYIKKHDSGLPEPIETDVYLLRVKRLEQSFPEVGQRKRKWVTPRRAAEMVDEPKLKAILRAL